MFKRGVAAVAWFISTWWAYALAAYVFGLPADGGTVLGVLVAAFVVLDPTGALWGPRELDVTETTRPDAVSLTTPTR